MAINRYAKIAPEMWTKLRVEGVAKGDHIGAVKVIGRCCGVVALLKCYAHETGLSCDYVNNLHKEYGVCVYE